MKKRVKQYTSDTKIDYSTELNLPFEYGEPINLGPAALAAKAQGVAIGEKEVYYAINGDPASFYAAAADTGEVLYTESIPNSDVIWGLTIGIDGNVYFSGTFDGILYRYVVDEKRIDKVGKNPSDNWVWQLKSADDGKIYGATYPNAKVFEYDIKSDKFIDLGTFKEGQLYARGIGVTDENLYVGIGTTASLHKMNRKTREKVEIQLPITGEKSSVSNIWEYGEHLFVAYGTSLLTVELDSGNVAPNTHWKDLHTFDGLISSPSPYDENLIYFRDRQTSQLWTYHMRNKSMQAVEPKVQLPESALKAMKWIKDEEGNDLLAMLHHQIEYSVYNPKTNELLIIYPEADMQGLAIQSLEWGPDHHIYMGGYQGSFGVFDTLNETYILRERDPHQIEGIGFLNGDVFLGTYDGARIYKYNPDLPYFYHNGGTGDNPEMVYGIPDGQSRPFTFANGDHKLFVGTIAGYGKLGGSLAIYDTITDKWSSTRNIVKNQSIIALAYQDGVLFGGSTIAGGLGIHPTEEKAKMFSYDIGSDEYNVFELDVEGLVLPKMIGELSIGPDHNLWGIAFGLDSEGINNSVVFAMDPSTKEVIKSIEVYAGVEVRSSWRPFFMRWDDQGLLFTTAGRRLTVIDPATMKSKQIIPNVVDLMDLDSEGNIYYANGANLYKMPVIII